MVVVLWAYFAKAGYFVKVQCKPLTPKIAALMPGTRQVIGLPSLYRASDHCRLHQRLVFDDSVCLDVSNLYKKHPKRCWLHSRLRREGFQHGTIMRLF